MNNDNIDNNFSKSEENQSSRRDDNFTTVVERFKNFRRDAEIREKKLIEYKDLIEQLKDDIKLSKEIENHLRDQITSSQSRLIQLQTSLHKLTVVSEQQRKNETVSRNIEKNIKEISEMVSRAQEKIQNLYKQALVDVDLLKQNNELKSVLKEKESQLNMLKINLESLMKEKSDLTLEFETKVKELEEELKKSKFECVEIKAQCDRNTSIYKKEIKEREEIIEEYERERKGLLEDFDTSKKPEKIFTSADSTVSFNVDDRAIADGNNSSLPTELQDESENALFLCTTNTPVQPFKPTPKFKKKENSQKVNKKGEKQKLQFLSPSQESKQNSGSSQPPSKRRLFSTNCNHYYN